MNDIEKFGLSGPYDVQNLVDVLNKVLTHHQKTDFSEAWFKANGEQYEEILSDERLEALAAARLDVFDLALNNLSTEELKELGEKGKDLE